MKYADKVKNIVEWLRTNIIPETVGAAHASKSEFKAFEVSEIDGFTRVTIDIGRIGDEGTAAVFCRTHYAFMISKRGSCTRIDSHRAWKGHPARTHYLPRTREEAKRRVVLNREMRAERKAQEADLFLRLNSNRKGAGAYDRFAIALTAERKEALAIERVLELYGCKLGRTRGRYVISAVNEVTRALRKSEEHLGQVIFTLSSWLDGAQETFDGKLIYAISEFFTACPYATPRHLVDRLRSHSPKSIIERLRSESKTTRNKSEAARVVFMEIYNYKTLAAKRVKWVPILAR